MPGWNTFTDADVVGQFTTLRFKHLHERPQPRVPGPTLYKQSCVDKFCLGAGMGTDTDDRGLPVAVHRLGDDGEIELRRRCRRTTRTRRGRHRGSGRELDWTDTGNRPLLRYGTLRSADPG